MTPFTLEDLVLEMLNIEKPEVKSPAFRDRVHNFLHRRDIEKQLQDEIAVENQRVLKLGKEAEEFLSSHYYRDLIEPSLKQTLKGGFQKIMLFGENMTESQIKSEVAVMRKAWDFLGSIRLKKINADNLKERLMMKEKIQ